MVQACSIRAVTKKKELILRSLFDIIANYLIYSKQCSIMEVNQSHFVEHDFFWDHCNEALLESIKKEEEIQCGVGWL